MDVSVPTGNSTLLGRRFIITGGASGMGAALVRDFAAQGSSVVSLDVDRGVGEAVIAKCEGTARFSACDVADEASVERAFAEAAEVLGGLDVLINAAGIAPGRPAEDITLESWDRMFAINSRGTFLTNRAAFGLLRESGGRIINFASGAGVRGYPGKAHYAASKGAVLAWSRSIAVEWAKHAINVNCIVPAIATPMYQRTRDSMSAEQLAEHDAVLARRIPMGGKLGNPARDLVPFMRWLAGPDSGFVTGQTFAIDGGLTMMR